MLDGKHFLVPEVDGHAYLNKPPLEFWLSRLVVKYIGQNNFGFRFVSALSGLLLVSAVFFFVFFIFDSIAAAVFSGLLLISSHALLMEHGFRRADLDGLLLLLQALALIAVYGADQARASTSRLKLSVFSGILIGTSVLVKSVAGYTALFIGLTYLAIRCQGRGWREFARISLCLTVPAVLVPAVYIICLLSWQPDALKTVWEFEIAGRVSVGYHHTSQPFFYLRMLFVENEYLPPGATILGLLFAAYSLIRRSFSPALMFLSLWALLPLAAYSAVPSRLVWYVFPSLPALAILSGLALAALLQQATLLSQRITPARLCALGGLLLCGANLISILASDAAAVSRPGKVLFLNKLSNLTQQLRSEDFRLYVDSDIRWTKHERVYARVLNDIGDEDLTAFQQDPGPGLMIVGYRNFKGKFGSAAFDSYEVLPSMYERRQDVIVLGRGLEQFSGLLRPKRARFLTPNGGLRPLHGLGWPGPDHSHVVQKSVEGHAAMLLAGDRLLQSRPVSLKLSIASVDTREEVSMLDIYFNEVKLGSIEVRSEYQEYAFLIPQGKFFPGDNVLMIVVPTDTVRSSITQFAIEHVELEPLKLSAPVS